MSIVLCRSIACEWRSSLGTLRRAVRTEPTPQTLRRAQRRLRHRTGIRGRKIRKSRSSRIGSTSCNLSGPPRQCRRITLGVDPGPVETLDDARDRQPRLVAVLDPWQVHAVRDADVDPEIGAADRGLDDPRQTARVELPFDRHRSAEFEPAQEAQRLGMDRIIVQRFGDRRVSHWPRAELAAVEACDLAAAIEVERAEADALVTAGHE